MSCCAGCFGDRGLRKSIIPLRSSVVGSCSFCASENAPILDPKSLAEYFEFLVSAYQPDLNGKFLVQLFRDDWGMFDHPRMDDSRARELLGEVLDDRDVVRRTFSPIGVHDADRVNEWETLRNELMYRNRFFPNVDIDLERLELLLSRLIPESDETPGLWYRARIQLGETVFPATEMGAPPRRTASHGRANPAGVPYLYLASTQEAAVSEVRPHTGEIACVAEFRTNTDLMLVDLRGPRRMVSPFLLEDAEDIARMRSDLPFLERLGEELTRPVVPEAAAIDYAPSQYLCEFIKKCGYDGVIYRSAVSDGINLALFDPVQAEPGSVTQYRIARVLVETAKVDTSSDHGFWRRRW